MEQFGLQQMTSTSSDGVSVITLQFNLSLNIDIAEQEVQQAINGSGTYLPPDLPTPPLYAKVNPADTPIITLALTGGSMGGFVPWIAGAMLLLGAAGIYFQRRLVTASK